MRKRHEVAVRPTDLKKALSQVPLPAMPDCAIRMLDITGERDDDTYRCTALIESDAAMAAQLLKFANSSYFGLRHRVSSIQQAITLLGLRKVRNFVLWNAVFGVTPDPQRRDFSMTAFRCDALRRGLFARLLAQRLGLKDAEDVFTAALLQDVATPLLLRHFGDDYAEVLEDADSTPEAGDAGRARCEQQALGVTHAEAACLLFKKWKLPSVLADLVVSHSDALQLLDEGNAGPDAQAVAVSALLPASRDECWSTIDTFLICWERLAFAQDTPLVQLLGDVDDTFEGLAQVLNVGSSVTSLVSLLDNTKLDNAKTA